MALARHTCGPSQGGARGLKAAPTVAVPLTEHAQSVSAGSEQVLRAASKIFFSFLFFVLDPVFQSVTFNILQQFCNLFSSPLSSEGVKVWCGPVPQG